MLTAYEKKTIPVQVASASALATTLRLFLLDLLDDESSSERAVELGNASYVDMQPSRQLILNRPLHYCGCTSVILKADGTCCCSGHRRIIADVSDMAERVKELIAY